MNTFFIGDVHLSSMNTWNLQASQNFVDWFKDNFKSENKENNLIWLGDLSDKAINPGTVVDLLFKLMEFCNSHFKKTYVLMGNHDIKMYRDFSLQSAITFLNNFEDVEVIDDIRVLNINGKEILCLPFMRDSVFDNINEYYSNYDWKKNGYNKIYDLAIGHWTIKNDDDIRFRDGVDVTNIPTKELLCGHIHNRPDERYIGSVYPLNSEEMKCKYPRVYKIWKEDGSWQDIKLPEFLSFETIEYGAELKHDNVVRVYTVSDAPSEVDAIKKYDGFIIKGVTKLKQSKNSLSSSTGQQDITNKNNMELFDQMVKEQNLVVTRGAYKVIKELLSK